MTNTSTYSRAIFMHYLSHDRTPRSNSNYIHGTGQISMCIKVAVLPQIRFLLSSTYPKNVRDNTFHKHNNWGLKWVGFICTNETSSNEGSFLQYLTLFWPVRQSRAAVEPNLSLSQNTPISWYTYIYTWICIWWCVNCVTVFIFLVYSVNNTSYPFIVSYLFDQ